MFNSFNEEDFRFLVHVDMLTMKVSYPTRSRVTLLAHNGADSVLEVLRGS